MFGSHSIGSAAVGSSGSFIVVLTLDVSEFESDSNEIITKTILASDISEIRTQVDDFITKTILYSSISEANKESLSFQNSVIRMTLALGEVDAESLAISTHTRLASEISELQTDADSFITKTVLGANVSESSAESSDYSLYLTLPSSVSEADIMSKDLSLYIRIASEISEASSESNDLSLYITNFMETLEFQSEALLFDRNAFGRVNRELDFSLMSSQALNFDRLAFGTVDRQAEVSEYNTDALGKDLKIFLHFETSGFQMSAKDIGAQVFGKATVTLELSKFDVSSLESSALYLVRRVPDLITTNMVNAVELESENKHGTHIQYYKGDGHIARFNPLDSKPISDMSLLDSNVTSNPAYKYKAAFAVEGNIGGQDVYIEGQKSKPRIVIRR